LFGVDACFLHERFAKNSDAASNDSTSDDEYAFDVVIFHHPHLGSSSSNSNSENDKDDSNSAELDLVQRHASLLAHYLASAQQISKTVHVALGCNQAASWRLVETAHCLNLQLMCEIPVQHPFHQIFPVDDDDDASYDSVLFPWQKDPDWKPYSHNHIDSATTTTTTTTTSRKQKSRHWLGRYGYQHVRTEYKGQSEAPNLAGSKHYVFQQRQQQRNKHQAAKEKNGGNIFRNSPTTTSTTSPPNQSAAAAAAATTTCSVCGMAFQDPAFLDIHIKAPALPSGLIAKSSSDGEKTEMATVNNDHGLSSTKSTTVGSSSSSYNDTKQQLELQSQEPSSSRVHHVSTTTTRGQNGESSSPSFSAAFPAGGDDDAALIAVLTVPCEYDGKRLRWFLQHHCSAAANCINDTRTHTNNDSIHSKLSKRQWEGLIKNGGVSVNGVVAIDSGRILCTGWTVSIHGTTSSDSNRDDNAKTRSVDVVASLLPKPLEQDRHEHPIQVVAQEEHGDVAFCIVWKSVGMRTIGSFDSRTLEETFARQHQQKQAQEQAQEQAHEQQLQVHAKNSNRSGNSIAAKYKSLSKLDTGCSGLCVLQNVNYNVRDGDHPPPLLKVTHTFTILVHGRVPDEWIGGIVIDLPTDGMRRWKRQKQNAPTNSTGAESTISSSSPSRAAPREGGCPATLCCLEQATLLSPMMGCRNNKKNHVDKHANTATTRSSVPLSSGEIVLSTVTITTDSQSSGLVQTIVYYLRKTAGHPVVGDRFAVSEYLSLPRSIRNRIKQRLCMGCTRVLVTIPAGDNSRGSSRQQHYTRPCECKVPEKWSAAFWRDFCAAAAQMPTSTKTHGSAN
jgi:hypothetical protein